MTTTDSTGTHLLAAILANPDDDDVRLAYSDWLEESGEAERAEFIRVQIQRARSGDALHGADITSAILNRHPEWSRAECQECDGTGGVSEDSGGTTPWGEPVNVRADCPTCNGFGDLLRRYETGTAVNPSRYKIYWSRGFIEVVEARSGEVWYEQEHGMDAGDVLPTPWALAIVAALPGLREIRLTDRTTRRYGIDRTTWTAPGDFEYLPMPIWESFSDDENGWPYPTEESATTALARAVADWVRQSHLDRDQQPRG